MTTSCPACNKSVDPLRSRFVGVLDGKVVAYCSAECARGGPVATGAAAVAAPTPAAAGAPTAAVVAAPATASAVATQPAGKPARAASSPAAVAAPTTAAVAAPATASAVATQPTGKPARAATSPAAAIKTPASGVPLEPPTTPAPGVPITFDSGPVIEIVQEPASGVVAAAPSTSEDGSEPRAKHPDEIAIGKFWREDHKKSGAAQAIGDPTTGQGASVAADVPARSGRDDTLDKWATDEVSERGATRELSEGGDRLRRKSRLPLVLLVVLLLGGGGLLVYQFLVKGNVAAATRLSPGVAPAVRAAVVEPVPVAPPAEPAVAPEAAVAQARAVLVTALAAASQRLQRIAAAALARTSDPAACQVLAAQLGLGHARTPQPPATGASAAVLAPPPVPETSDIARLDLAYSLARAGDKRGRDVLAAALYAPRGEARDEAARLFALLGDPRAIPHLVDVLAVSQRRLGAAEHLAHLAEPHAIKVLEQIRGDAKASADDKARAAIALGIAGHADLAPALREMLADPHFNAFAAAALAELKDSAARPVLERQLDSPALRVRSARALRRLDPVLDLTPVLPRLLDVLKTGRDTDQIQAAEAILLLAGPPAWSAFE